MAKELVVYFSVYGTAKLEPEATVLTGLPVEMRDAENGSAEAVEKWLKSLH